MSGSTIDTSTVAARDFRQVQTRTVQVGPFMVSQPMFSQKPSVSTDGYVSSRVTPPIVPQSAYAKVPNVSTQREPLPHEEYYSDESPIPYDTGGSDAMLPYETSERGSTPEFGSLTLRRTAQNAQPEQPVAERQPRQFVLKNNFSAESAQKDSSAPAADNVAKSEGATPPMLLRTTNSRAKNIFFNGKIDNPINQGTAGDCWLLSAVDSLASKPAGKKYLESLLTKNEENGTISVHLKKPDATYTYTQKDINDASHLSMGDDDVRAIEMAVGQHIEHLQASGKYNQNRASMESGDNAINAWKFLLGNQGMYAAKKVSNVQLFSEEYDSYNDVINDFSNPKKVFTFSVGNKDIDPTIPVKMAAFEIENTKNGQVDNLYYNHSYAVVGSDESYVYLRNPHDTSITYRCQRNLLERHAATIEVGKIPD